MICVWTVYLALAATGAPAVPVDTRALIRTPNNGRPVIVAPGAAFSALLDEEARLRLVRGETAVALSVSWADAAGGGHQARCPIPDNAPPGDYAIEAATPDGLHRNIRSVFVREQFPNAYNFAHVTDVHIGGNDRPSPKETFRAVIQAVNASDAEFVLVTGDLTEHAAVDEFNDFTEVLNICEKPTFVCGGERDRTGTLYEDLFGPEVYAFRFGEDGYLGFDAKAPAGMSALDTQDGDLERLRRKLKPCRWTIGFTHRYGDSLREPHLGMRTQLVLFVDNPLDLLVFGHWERENTEEVRRVPWNTTRLVATPAARDRAYRIIDVTPKGVVPRPPEYATTK
ncbi:MAG TPA: hypothetical protein HPP77_09035 [Candidatus Hydrogenedentes bacterium]|nr:hypothetical protein [Candidatus Hydrogenedentota bacterium]HIJ73343.1 hypothetical protein [Candidatus Hydrogenedentota bacterium]